MSVTGLVGVLNAFSEFCALSRSGGGCRVLRFMGTTVQISAGLGVLSLILTSSTMHPVGRAAAMSFILSVSSLL